MKKSRIAAALLVAALLIGFLIYRQAGNGQNSDAGLTRYTASFLDVFDTQTEIVGYGTSEETFTEQVKLLKDKLTFYNNLYDIYHDYEGINNIKTINDNAGIAPVVVDKEIIELLQYSKDMYEFTEGQLNIAMGSVLTIWHDYREEGINNPEKAKLPDMAELQTAAAHTDISQLIIDQEASTVYLADPEMSLDVGGIGKGYAVQRVAEYAKELGVESILLSVGGNVAAVGEKPDGSQWKLGIQNPDLESDEEYSRKVQVKDESVVTSGNYQRYYVVDGVRYCHIVDPDTLMPADYFASVSIITADSGEADALSTAVYNMPFAEGLAYVNGLDGVEAMWIFEDGSVEYSAHFEEYVAE
ncbi:MAG: FAD:protein FMN transferase [Roseburia sp.]|nr:FAD:protein FMN transferase [Roseburia sp.]